MIEADAIKAKEEKKNIGEKFDKKFNVYSVDKDEVKEVLSYNVIEVLLKEDIEEKNESSRKILNELSHNSNIVNSPTRKDLMKYNNPEKQEISVRYKIYKNLDPEKDFIKLKFINSKNSISGKIKNFSIE